MPNHEFDLRRQMRKAAISIPSNVAEGHKRRSGAYINHVSIASGSQGELDTQLELAVRLKLLPAAASAPVIQLTDRVGGMLWRLDESLREAQQQQRNNSHKDGMGS